MPKDGVVEYWSVAFRDNITPSLQYSIIPLSILAASLQPEERQHVCDEPLDLSDLIARRKSQHRGRKPHVDPALNQTGALCRRTVGEPDFDQLFGGISRRVVVVE